VYDFNQIMKSIKEGGGGDYIDGSGGSSAGQQPLRRIKKDAARRNVLVWLDRYMT
jgi:hypothetical protein